MLILLPPSETKRPGGRRAPLDLVPLRAARRCAAARTRCVDALVALSADEEGAARVLKLGATQRGEIARQRRAARPRRRWPAIDRYTGVLYDALDAASLDRPRRALARRARAHPLRAVRPCGRAGSDPGISARGGSVASGAPAAAPAVGGCRDRGARASRTAVRARPALRGVRGARPVPPDVAVGLRAGRDDADGEAARALNHFNKHAKGALVRRLAQERPRIASRAGFVRWADAAGLRVRDGLPGELQLFV